MAKHLYHIVKKIVKTLNSGEIYRKLKMNIYLIE